MPPRAARAARDLTKRRNTAAPRFCREVGKQMARLEMGRAELVWDSRELPRERWTAQGPCAASCCIAARRTPPRPLRRIASGGELSRVMLAAKVVLGESDAVDTLVFDEVDAGVGGATARSLAQVLADLARTHQVIVVTHLAQVAVQGSVHYVVRRSDDGDMPETRLVRVEGSDRVTEVACLLSGMPPTSPSPTQAASFRGRASATLALRECIRLVARSALAHDEALRAP